MTQNTKRGTLEARDLERPLGGGVTPIDAVIEVVKSDCPGEWSRYCYLTHQLAQKTEPTEISLEEAGRQHLAADGKSMAQRWASLDGMIAGYSSLAGFGRPPKTQLEIMVAETQTLEDLFRKQLLLALQTGRYSLIAYDRLSPFTVLSMLIGSAKAGDLICFAIAGSSPSIMSPPLSSLRYENYYDQVEGCPP